MYCLLCNQETQSRPSRRNGNSVTGSAEMETDHRNQHSRGLFRADAEDASRDSRRREIRRQ